MKNSKGNIMKQKKTIVALAVTLVVLLGSTYALLRVSLKGVRTVQMNAGDLKLTLNEENEFNVASAYPMDNDKGLAQTPYSFEVYNSGNVPAVYSLILDNGPKGIDDVSMGDNIVKYNLKLSGEEESTTALFNTLSPVNYVTDNNLPTPRYLVKEKTIAAGTTDKYELKLWINEDADGEDVHVLNDDGSVEKVKVFSKKIEIDAIQEQK